MNVAMDSDEAEVYAYLKTTPGQFISAREICRRAGGKWRYREDEHWAMPVLRRMAEKNLVEADETGHYRLPRKDDPQKEKKRWVCPQIRSIFLRSGRDFPVISADEDLDPEDLVTAQIPSTQNLRGLPDDSESN